MKELKTYFFIAGVAHEGNDKEWVRAEDVDKLITEFGEAASEEIHKLIVNMEKVIDPLTEAAQGAADRIQNLSAEVKSLKETNDWKQRVNVNLCKNFKEMANAAAAVLRVAKKNPIEGLNFVKFIQRMEYLQELVEKERGNIAPEQKQSDPK